MSDDALSREEDWRGEERGEEKKRGTSWRTTKTIKEGSISFGTRTHMLFPKLYMDDCILLTGQLVQHDDDRD